MSWDARWPAVVPLVWTLVTVAAAWTAGWLLSAVVRRRLPRKAEGRRGLLVAAVDIVVCRRLPFWILLLGIWLSLAYWPLSAPARLLAERAVFVLAAASITLALAALAARVIDVYGALVSPTLPLTSLSRNIASGLTLLIGALVVLNGLGISITPMLTALGVGGLAVALALQEPLANFFAGVFIALAGQLRVGDYVKLDSGQEGYIADFSWRSTRVRMLSNNLILVPNARLAQSIIVNHHLPSQDLAVLVEVGVDYASDLEQVERVVGDVGREVMTGVPGGVADFEPFIRFHTFADSSVNFTVILRAREFVDQYLIKHEFIKRLHARFDREGIMIPFPIRTLVRRP
jgi:small-conductance mechanosensitive channel